MLWHLIYSGPFLGGGSKMKTPEDILRSQSYEKGYKDALYEKGYKDGLKRAKELDDAEKEIRRQSLIPYPQGSKEHSYCLKHFSIDGGSDEF